MTASVGQLDQEISDLEAAIAAIRDRIAALSIEYAHVMSKAVRKQLILTTYHLCTRKHPVQFLALSLADRQSFQAQIVFIADQAAAKILESLSLPLSDKNPDEVDQILGKLLTEIAESMNEILSRAGIITAQAENADKVQLRLPEVEFTDRTVMSQRGELRVLANRLQQLEAELSQKIQAKLIIRADQAWRVTWTEAF